MPAAISSPARRRPISSSTPIIRCIGAHGAPAALAEAKRRDCPILLSIGYAACHWCHVMAHESFENAETARLMNDLFVNIKVDREERPDIDHIYMTALHALGQQGGWPLTMFLSPDGQPMLGGTYWPPEPALGPPVVPAGARIRRCVLAHPPRSDGATRPRSRRSPDQALGAEPRPRRDAGRSDPHRRRASERGRFRSRRPQRRAEVPQCADLPLLLERDVPPRRAGLRRSFARHARGDERWRHLRSPRRRLRPLFDRRRMARAAFREDALRQRADPRTAGPGPLALARSDIRRSRA